MDTPTQTPKHVLTPAQQSWVDALRSGEFLQGKNYLKTKDVAYCCLGVACVLAERAGVKFEWAPQLGISYVPCQVEEYFGFRSDRPGYTAVPDTGLRESYITLDKDNDGSGSQKSKTFPQIADIIESHAHEIFLPQNGQDTPAPQA